MLEARAEFGLDERPARDCGVELAWIMHGGIFYCGVRDLFYESVLSTKKEQAIADAIETFRAGLQI